MPAKLPPHGWIHACRACRAPTALEDAEDGTPLCRACGGGVPARPAAPPPPPPIISPPACSEATPLPLVFQPATLADQPLPRPEPRICAGCVCS